jgi:excisionase family DNA binding protein
MIRRGDIRSVKLGGCRRVFRNDLDAYIASVRGRAS